MRVFDGCVQGEAERLEEAGTRREEQRAERPEGGLSARGSLVLPAPAPGLLRLLQLYPAIILIGNMSRVNVRSAAPAKGSRQGPACGPAAAQAPL